MVKKHDFEKVKNAALASAEAICRHYLPDGKREGGEWVGRNPTRQDKSLGSFKVNLNTGQWCEFATGDKGGDLIAFVAYILGVKMGQACKELAQFIGLVDNIPTTPAVKPKEKTFEPIYPPPPGAEKSLSVRHYKLGEPTKIWRYLDATKKLLQIVARFDRVNSAGKQVKEYRALVYGAINGREGWYWRQLPANRPLYGLDRLGSMDCDEVVLTEGEKAADAAQDQFLTRPCLTWPGGVKAVSKTDWSPLVGKKILYWPDNDEAGKQSVAELKAALEKVGVFSFQEINIEVFKKFSPAGDGGLTGTAGTWPAKADAADALELGWTADHLAELEKRGLLFIGDTATEARSKNSAEGDQSEVTAFKLSKSGVFAFDPKAKKYHLICAPLEILARSRDASGNGCNWGLLVRFRDHDGVERQWNIPMQLFASDGGAEVVRGLLDRGLKIAAHREAKRKVLYYLQDHETSKRVSVVYKSGWHRNANAFVLPDRTIGNPDEPLLFYGDGAALVKLQQRGTISNWQQEIATYCVGNVLAMFAVSAAFSAALIDPLAYETTGFHFYGDSSWGKSTLLYLACSVYGNPADYISTWRSTDNAMEGQAAARSDMLLALDEINQVDSRIIGEVVYMLGNGQGKQRANDRGQAKDSQHRWRLTFLSNGEKTLEQYLAESGKSQTGGMEMRFIGIQATFRETEEDKKKFGIFDSTHGFANGAALSDFLKNNMAKFHGTPFIAFIEKLVEHRAAGSKLIEWAHGKIADFRSRMLSADAGGQVIRAAKKFALVGCAGEIATRFGITGWAEGDAMKAAEKCFLSWLENRGGEGNLEDKQMLDHVRHQLTKYGEARFKRWDEPENGTNTIIDTHVPITAEAWGYRQEVVDRSMTDGNSSDVIFYIFPDAFNRDLCKAFDGGRVARLLRDKGVLEITEGDRKENRLTTKVRLPRMGKTPTRVYKLRSSQLMGLA
jgi:putative DNA primase/helicase